MSFTFTLDDWLLYVHLLCLLVAVIGIILADRAALGWMRGKLQTIEPKKLLGAHWTVTVALLGLVYSGLFLFWPMHEYLLAQPYFLVKMFLVGALLINGIAIDTLKDIASQQSFASLTSRQKIPLLMSGTISGLAWLGVPVIAYLQFGWLF